MSNDERKPPINQWRETPSTCTIRADFIDYAGRWEEVAPLCTTVYGPLTVLTALTAARPNALSIMAGFSEYLLDYEKVVVPFLEECGCQSVELLDSPLTRAEMCKIAYRRWWYDTYDKAMLDAQKNGISQDESHKRALNAVYGTDSMGLRKLAEILTRVPLSK